ncbi:hypothetical protein ACHAPU_001384 [Fusarium lateritium]
MDLEYQADDHTSPSDVEISTTLSKRPTEEVESGKARTKRSRTVKSYDADDVDDEAGGHSNAEDLENERVVQFACPYFRKCPAQHLECVNLKMPRISDVKQHLKRRHTTPFQCSKCCKEFSSSELLQDHVRLVVCPNVSEGNLESVSPEAQKLLKARFERGLSSTKQWHKIWEILFGPTIIAPRPQLDGVFKEVTEILRGTWKDEGRQIISDFVQTRDGSGVCEDKLYPLLLELLDRVEARFEHKSSEHHRQVVQDPESTCSKPTNDSEQDLMVNSLAFLTDSSDGYQSIFDMPTEITESLYDTPNSESEMAGSIYQLIEDDFINFQPAESFHPISLVSDKESSIGGWQPLFPYSGINACESAFYAPDSGYCGDDDTLSTVFEDEIMTL